jgi:23S rRNA pseudoU1915 N3-methylase RlmH
MKAIVGIISIGLALASTASADLVHSFKNPSFSGQGYSAHVLSLEQLEYNRAEDKRKEAEAEARRIERELENTVLSKFIKNLESRIYATLSKQLVDNMFAECGDGTEVACVNSGTTEVEGATITWNKDTTTGSITLIIDGPDGYTEITIPGPGEFNF